MADATAIASVGELAAASQVARQAVIAQVLREAQPYIETLRGRTWSSSWAAARSTINAMRSKISSGCAGWARIQCSCMAAGQRSTTGWSEWACHGGSSAACA